MAVRIENNMLEARKSNIPGFNRGSSSKVNEVKKKRDEGQTSSSDGVKELTDLNKQLDMKRDNQINVLQNKLIMVERSQGNNRQQHKPNDKWLRRPPQNDQWPPSLFETTNLVDHRRMPYCRPCGEFHEESTRLVFLEECNNEYDDQGNEQVNMCNDRYYGNPFYYLDVTDYGSYGNFMSGVVDKATEKYGPKPTPHQVAEMACFRGITYHRKENKSQEKGQTSPPKVSPPKSKVSVNTNLNIDLGGWLNSVKMLVPISELIKIPSQKEKLLKAIDEPPVILVEKQVASAYHDALVILQNWDRKNEKNFPFYLSLVVNNKVLHNCMLDSGATSNVITKKVMEQLNLRISRPNHNICALDSQTIEVHGLIKGLQVYLATFPDIMIEMDIVVIDVPDVWGMLLNRKTVADLGGSLQMDLSYATIPTPDGGNFKLNREVYRKYHVEDPKKPQNELN
jgi:hypothetical protein